MLTARRASATLTAAPMPPHPVRHPVVLEPSYLAALRDRVDALGVSTVAAAAGMTRQTAWRAFGGEQGRRVNADQIEQIRLAVVKLERAQPDPPTPLPPPLVAVRSIAHGRWIALADRLTDAELVAATDAPDRVIAAAKRPAPRRK